MAAVLSMSAVLLPTSLCFASQAEGQPRRMSSLVLTPAMRLRGGALASAGVNKLRRPSNAPGNLFVDESCIDCDTCRWMAPSTFARDSKSYVKNQPVDQKEQLLALSAAVACPTGSIRLEKPDPQAKQAREAFPKPVDAETIANVYHLGFHSAASFGATPYLLAHSSISCMVDSPRFNSRLASSIEAVCQEPRFMLLTHVDDVADHAQWKQRWPGLVRVMHEADVRGPDQWPYTDLRDVEMKLEGQGPWELAPGLMAVHTPGHSRGSVCFLASAQLCGGQAVLFTGDHLAFNARLDRLDGFGRYGWDLALQAQSMRKLADLSFTWILPGHGRKWKCDSESECAVLIREAADNFAADPLGRTTA